MLRISLTAALLALLASPITAQASMGPLTEYLPAEQMTDPWHYQHVGDAFRVTNTSDPGSLEYYYTDGDAGPGSRRTIAVDVQAEAGEGSLAGLLYAFDPDARSYFLFVLEPGGKATFFRRDAQGFNAMISAESDAISEGTNRLMIEETADTVRLFANGEKLAEMGTDGIGRGGVGIAVAGIVRATFSNFTIDRQDAEAPAADPFQDGSKFDSPAPVVITK